MTLRCESLCKVFQGTIALDNFTLDFPSSGIVAIIGPNGAGKTTLLNVITGFQRPDTGKVYLSKKELTYIKPHQIAHLGIVRTFQELRLITQVSVLENILLVCSSQKAEGLISTLFGFGISIEEKKSKERAIDILSYVGLEAMANCLVDELSYGQQKLLTLACCVATEASILLLDEPVAGVHPEMALRIIELMRKIGNAGKQIIFVEHDLEFVRKIADHLIVMAEGRVIIQGNPVEVLERPEIIEAYIG